MRSLLLFVVLLFCTLPLFAQEEEVETYLIVRIQRQNNKSNPYFTIEADLHNDHALALYELMPFDKTLFVPKKGIHFYYNRPDSAEQYYNYFKSESEALDFIGKQQWGLVTVLSEVSTDKRSDGFAPNDRIYTMVSSRPVYYFRKKVAPLDVITQ
ncbi:MAG TPA: hypothetical protein VGE66_11800 [Chitinophagaceae bacterium]